MNRIPLIDIRDSDLRQLVRDHRERAKELVGASRKTFGLFSEIVCAFATPYADRLSRDWLRDNHNPYFDEIKFYADHLQEPGIYALNICFEWGCTSAVYAKSEGPLLTRVLDWPFPKLGENIVVAHQRGTGGDFYNVTWPGVSGMFHGMAPGRFSASLNQAPMRRHQGVFTNNCSFLGDWIKNRQGVWHSDNIPPAHLLRQVFEEATSYAEAQERLAKTPVALPVIYILAGIEPGEGCVIERTEYDYDIRPMGQDRVSAANQFETRLNETGVGWRPRRIDSAGRLRQAETLPMTSIDKNFSWFQAPIANAHSRLAMTASASDGQLSVFGTYGAKRVTEIFTLPPHSTAATAATAGGLGGFQ